MSFRYKAFGLRIESDFALPELRSDEATEAADLSIELGDLPAGPGDYHVAVEGGVTTIWVPDANAVYRMIDGRRLVVDPQGGEVGRNVRLYLLGSALGAILHQRGLLPLHACALEFGGKAVAFLGHSGAGKSTLAARLAERGGRLLSDDVCVVRPRPGGGYTAAVGIPRLRLWRDAIEVRGAAADDYPRSFDDWDKYDVPAEPEDGEDEVELAALFELAAGEGMLSFRPIRGAEAVQCLAANTYRGSYVRAMGRIAEHLAQCIDLARSLPLERAERSLDHARMDADCSRLLERIAQLVG